MCCRCICRYCIRKNKQIKVTVATSWEILEKEEKGDSSFTPFPVGVICYGVHQ